MLFKVIQRSLVLPLLLVGVAWQSQSACIASQLGGAAKSSTSSDTSDDAAASPAVEIADEPRSIDPASVVGSRMAKLLTVEFSGVTLREVYRWLQDEQKLSVSVNAAELNAAGILSSDIVTEKLSNEPLYLLLDRLRSLGIGWYEDDDTLFLTTAKKADQEMVTVPYNLGTLLDAGFDGEEVVETIRSTISDTDDGKDEGDDAIVLLGDVVFIRENQRGQREVAGLLEALRKPARKTRTLDPPQHDTLRNSLEEKFSLTLQEVPLNDAVEEISKTSGVSIRLNPQELRKSGTRDRTPVTVELKDQKLRVVLQAMLSELKLTWLIRDGVIWVVSQDTADGSALSAVFDVRDLCRDLDESEALSDALQQQAGGEWTEIDGTAVSISFAKPGIMVVRHTGQMLTNVERLLGNYRQALRESKPRETTKLDPDEVLTYYYKLPTPVASDLLTYLPSAIRPETWQSEAQPQAPGTILRLASATDLHETYTRVSGADKSGPLKVENRVVIENSVLIIRQTRQVHGEINTLIDKIVAGDRPPRNEGGGQGGGGLGGGMGGFGGGFFSVDSEKAMKR